MAPLVKELKKHEDKIKCEVAVTAQHRDMLDQVLALFQIKPDYDLNIMKKGQTLFDITNRALKGLGEIMEANNPDLVLVHGDTSTTFTAALSAYYLKIAVGHVEAGLRTYDKYSPFPEEMNRCLTGALADFHFAPTEQAKKNLLKEGIPSHKIWVTGNTVIDALFNTLEKEYQFKDKVLNNLDNSSMKTILLTTHRRENLGKPMRNIYRALARLINYRKDVQIVFPMHPNPLVRKVVQEELGDLNRVHLIEPLDYQPFVRLMQKSTLVLTDSGGMQEEAPSLGKPVLVLRDTTERPEALKAGTVLLVGTDQEKIFQESAKLLDDEIYYRSMSEAINPYGDGKASFRIAEYLLHYYGLKKNEPSEFVLEKNE